MKRGNTYFLVARDRESNRFEIVPIDSSWGNKLEEIDLYTTNYQNSYDLTQKLIEDGTLSSLDNDFYIVYQKNERGTRLIQTQEVLFSNHQEIRPIAKASLNKTLDSSKEVDSLLGRFCYRMKTNQKYYDMVVFGQTDIYKKFSNYFSNKRFLDFYQVKYLDGGWAKKSYPLLRNIVESFQRLEGFPRMNENNPYSEREKNNEKLLLMTDKDYDRNQLSLFDVFDMEEYGYQKCKQD